ncbi:hypothetical protein [Marinobacter sp. M3C]|jgi:hypothetical protein|nr:hypothetical protein [Marinobacter sp. M3C]
MPSLPKGQFHAMAQGDKFRNCHCVDVVDEAGANPSPIYEGRGP